MSDTISPEADEALGVITALCGGPEYVKVTSTDSARNYIEVEAQCSDDLDGFRRITIGIDGRVMQT